MRIATNTVVGDSLYNVSLATERFAKAQGVVSTGKQLTKPSDDPAGIGQSLSLRNALDNVDQWKRNIDDARGFLGTTDTALSNVTSLLRNARSLAVQGANDGSNTDNRVALSGQVSELITALGNVTKTTYGSRYVFSGQRTNQPPFQPDANGNPVYKGGTSSNAEDKLIVDIGQGETIQANVTGETLLSQAFTTLATLRDHLATASASTISGQDIAAVDQVLQSLTATRAEVGSRVQLLDQTGQRLDQSKVNLADYLSKIEDADLPKAILELHSAETAYQGALAASTRGFQQSLLDFLK